MRVLHINCNYTRTTLHQLMIEHLSTIGIDNKVFVPVYSRKFDVINPNDNVIVSKCFRKHDRLLFYYKQNKIQKSLENHYSVKDFDLIHAYTLFTDGNCARSLSRKYGVPYVVAVRNTDLNTFFRLRPYLRRRGIKIMLDANAVFFLSESYRIQLLKKYIPDKYHVEILNKSYIIPNGVDDFWFVNKNEYNNVIDKTVKLIFAGRIDRNKNIATTQKAMSILRKKGYNISLTIVGKIADKKIFKKIKKDKYTNYLSARPKEKLMVLYRKHNIFVMP